MQREVRSNAPFVLNEARKLGEVWFRSGPRRAGSGESFHEFVLGAIRRRVVARRSQHAAPKALQAVEGVCAGKIAGEEVGDPVGQNVSAEFEGVAAADPGRRVRKLPALNVGEARAEEIAAHDELLLAAVEHSSLRGDCGGLSRLVIPDV